jgi:Concanavalin A-like lectin/glucanases superfamily
MATYNDAALTYDAATTTYDGYGTQLKIPYVVVEVAFDDGPYVASPTWTDISSYVRSINIRRGRNDDLSVFTGTANLVLSNNDRRFDPFYTSGPYYGKLLPRRQIRIRSIVESSTYAVFRGFVAGWPVSYTEAGRDSTVTVEAFDALSLLSVDATPANLYEDYVQSLTPIRWYKMNETVSNTTTVRDTANELPLTPVSTNPPFSPSGNSVGRLEQSALDLWYYAYSFSGTPPFRPVPDNFTTSSFSISMWVKCTDTSTGSTIDYTYGGLQVIVYIAENSISAAVRNLTSNTASTSNSVTTTGDMTSDFRHVVVSYSGSGGVGGSGVTAIYVDGFESNPGRTNNIATTSSGENLTVQRASIAQLAVFNPAITTAQAQALYYRGLNTINETTAARFNRLIGYSSFPSGLTSAPASPQGTVAAIDPDSELSSQLKLDSDSEGGELYVDKTGVVTMTVRDSQNTATRSVTTQAEFKDDGTSLKYGTSLEIRYDADSIVNDFTYQFSNGTVTIRDSTSVSTYGLNSTTVATQLGTYSDAETVANKKLGVFSEPVPAVSPLLVSVTRIAADWKDLLDLELLDQITVTRTPSIGNAVEVRMLVNALEHQITPGDWRMSVTGSARYAEWFTADLDFADGPRYVI